MTQENNQVSQQALNLSNITLNQDIIDTIAELQSTSDTFETDTHLDTIAQLMRTLIAEADESRDAKVKNSDVSLAQGLLRIEDILKTLALRK